MKELRLARRKMARGRDWEVEGKTVVLSVAGFYGLLAALGVEQKKAALLQEACLMAAPEKIAAALEGRVERFAINRLLLLVRLSDGRLVKLRVARGRELFKKGMKVPIRPVGNGVVWELARNAPRRVGRW